MQVRSKHTVAVAAALIVAGLAGCGGGGGADVPTPVVDAQPLAITVANHETVARQSTQASSYLLDTGSLVNGAQLAPDTRTLISFTRGQLARVGTLFRAAPQRVGGATFTETIPCSGGGSITATANDANGNGDIDNGDSAQLVASGCFEAGATLSGTLAMSFSGVSGDPLSDVFGVTAAVTLTNLRAVTGAGDVTGNGSMTLVINSTGANRLALDIQVPVLVTSGQIGGLADTMTLQNWRIVSSTAPTVTGIATTITASGTTISTALEGKAVTVATVVPLVVLESDLYPSSGQFTATGAAGSKVRVTALNASTARIELDENGDGSYERSVDRAWSVLN